ncbi:hypothetical protein L9F63_004491 [Diploptera punctata]|uniref:Protein CNPPD1 n=1 Tax=Diploptera punctata TaxID=6984 RepID=A0AAD8E7U8_DIPPU|nr:hypothetical protein L9F63_004491 [Diploptera punctata]
MSSLSVSPKRRRFGTKSKLKVMGDHNEFLSRIKKTLYYGKLPNTERFSLPVTELAAELFSEVKNGKSLERLDLDEAAAMTRNACVSPCSLVLALLYLERLKSCNPDYLQRVAPSELFLVSMMVASKFLHDEGETDEVYNDEWAASAGISVKEMNRFERDFLQAIQWEVFVSEHAFWTRLSKMEREVALKEGRRRGWFSYTDLEKLMETVDLASLAQALVTVSAVCLTSYTASVLTLIGSAFIVSQIPGIPLTTSVSSLTCSVPRTLVPETTINSTVEQLLPTVDMLTTGFILASLTSCPSENNLQPVAPLFDNRTCSFHHLLTNRTENVCQLGSNEWVEIILEWTKFTSWHWWKMEFEHLISDNNQVNKSKDELTSGRRKHSSSNRSRLNSHSTQTRETNDAQDASWEWVTEIRSWLDLTALEKSSHTRFFPLEITTSNY